MERVNDRFLASFTETQLQGLSVKTNFRRSLRVLGRRYKGATISAHTSEREYGFYATLGVRTGWFTL